VQIEFTDGSMIEFGLAMGYADAFVCAFKEG
jgi:hypothetical protein